MSDTVVLNSEDVKGSNEKQLLESPEVETFAQKVIEKHQLEFGPAEIGYFLVYPNLSKKMAAKAIKASREVKYYSGNDYLIEISGEVWDMLDDQTKEILVFHELLKLEPVFRSKTQEWQFSLRKPDYGTFYKINEDYGADWYKTVQATVSSLYDLTPSDESKVTL
jgi:hypothetical protein